VSRIFDALRKSEQEKTETNLPMPQPHAPRVKQSSAPREELPASFENVERLSPRITPDKHILTSEDNPTSGVERFRVLRHRLQKLRAERSLRKLLVSSAVPGEGKTFVAVNLAFSLAKMSRRVLLIDADLRGAGAHEVFGLEEMSGLAECIQGEIDERAAIRRLDPWSLYYMPSGRCPASPGELLQGRRMGELLKRMGEAFDWVVVDTAPITLFADTAHLANLVDGCLLVTRMGVTPADGVQQAVATLEGDYIAGVVMNGEVETGNHHHSYYGYARVDHVEDPPKDEKPSSEKGSERG
jgi:capsular exopolysaccharide synthesis family protein